MEPESLEPVKFAIPSADAGTPAATAIVSLKNDHPSVAELLEKNLKWSQIIYEQNRKINSKLFWAAVANWLRLLLIVIPLILGLLFLPSFIRGLASQYSSVLSGFKTSNTGTSPSPATIENILKLLPLDTAQRDQLKAILK